MYFGYFFVGPQGQEKCELAIAPEKATQGLSAVPITKLKKTENSLFFISTEESVRISSDQNGLVTIEAMKPAKMYLTPNRPERPGFAVTKVGLKFEESGFERVYFDRDKGWEEFNPNKKDY